MYSKIDHVGIAVKSLSEALRVYSEAMGLRVDRIEDVPEQGTRVSILPIGESRLELLEPAGADSPVARFLTKRGEGLHHICLRVENIAQEINKLLAAGVRMIDQTPRRGADGCLVAFVHPASARGVLIELSQPE